MALRLFALAMNHLTQTREGAKGREGLAALKFNYSIALSAQKLSGSIAQLVKGF